MMLWLLGLLLAAVTGALVWCASARWWHALIIAVLWMPLSPLVANWLTGDVSRYLPPGAFAEGIEGRDEVIVASVVSTMLLAIAAAALLVWAARVALTRLRGAS